MKKMSASGFEIGKRNFLLWVKSYILLYHLHRNEEMTEEHREYMDKKYNVIFK